MGSPHAILSAIAQRRASSFLFSLLSLLRYGGQGKIFQPLQHLTYRFLIMNVGLKLLPRAFKWSHSGFNLSNIALLAFVRKTGLLRPLFLPFWPFSVSYLSAVLSFSFSVLFFCLYACLSSRFICLLPLLSSFSSSLVLFSLALSLAFQVV